MCKHDCHGCKQWQQPCNSFQPGDAQGTAGPWLFSTGVLRAHGINIGSASQIENGKRPPTEAVAARCDEAFPERKGWFAEYYEESKSWLPPGLRSWAEHEDKAVRLEVWVAGYRPRAVPDGGLRPRVYRRAPWRHFGRNGRTADQQDGAATPRAHAGRPSPSLLRRRPPCALPLCGIGTRSWPARWTTSPRWPRCRTSRCRYFRPSRIRRRRAS